MAVSTSLFAIMCHHGSQPVMSTEFAQHSKKGHTAKLRLQKNAPTEKSTDRGDIFARPV
jgi:hypothetical protein